ncbi:MAG: polysaccharide deacetylase family protein [Candidatus Riflebacteria bacterium]|nr:polysaccharide deacetylase family protein [Candidatus Riflebacteria bacterium]
MTTIHKNTANKEALFLLMIFLTNFLFSENILFGNEITHLANILQREPRNVNVLNSYGIELAKYGDLSGAIRIWRYALDIEPHCVHLYNNIGGALRRMGYLNDALNWYKSGLQFEPTYWMWYNMGLLREDLKQFPEALQAYSESLRLSPSFSQARERFAAVQTELMVKAPVNVENRQDNVISIPSEDKSILHKKKKQQLQQILPEPPVLHSDPISVPLRLPHDEGGQVFLTFDGGADADGLPGILSELGQRNIKSTFFLTGQFVKKYPELSREILNRGHEIANHSMSHPDMSDFGEDKISTQIQDAQAAIFSVTGRNPVPWFRFPFGAQNRRVEEIVEKIGYKSVYWTIDTLDWKEPSVSSIISKVRSKLKKNSVILMHCGSRNGAKALKGVLDEIIMRGYSPEILSAAPSNVRASF